MTESPVDPAIAPEVMFLPLAAELGAAWRARDPAVFARRIPDFLHQVLNQGQIGPTAMLELQTAAEEKPVHWVHLEAPPDREEAFAFLPNGLDVRAVVSGEIVPVDDGLRIEFTVYRDEEAEEAVTATVSGTVPLGDPVPALLRLGRHLARLLELPFHTPPRGLLTGDGRAFCLFLQGLDNAMLLSGDLEIAMPEDREALMRPFAEALAIDPGFGLALRVANSTAALALDSTRLDRDMVRRFLDRCYQAQPNDADACVAIAEQLADMGDDERALAWLERATGIEPPPARGLESMGLMMARRGDRARARDLWQKGLEVDGHPDFFSHLAQLAFAEDRDVDAWELTCRGLTRLRERTLRAAEWDASERGAGVLLECLHAQVQRRVAPVAVVDLLVDLRGMLADDDRIFLGLCLHCAGRRKEARSELIAGLRTAIDGEVRDLGVRALLQLDVAGFEGRFARACDRAQRGRHPQLALGEFQLWLQLQPEFWPALFYSAIAKRRLGAADEALDLLAAANDVAPGQTDVLLALADGFDRRRNPKHANELIDEALGQRWREPRLHGAKVRYLQHLGRAVEAKDWLVRARADGIESDELRKLWRRLRRS
jgi:tetratricopeptide (TPR) repeat protein